MEVVKNLSKRFFQFFDEITLINYVAFICVIFIFAFSVNSRLSNFYCLLENTKISSLQGFIVSNPVLTSSSKYYKCDFSPNCAMGQNQDSIYSASGKVTLLFSKELVESHYPGKLYTAVNKSIFIETGALLKVDVNLLSKNSNEFFFIVKSADFLGWKNYLSKIRGFFRLQFKRLMYMWGSAGGLLLALLSASKEYTSSAFSEAFRLAGLSHILALSGMHVSIFSSLTEKSFIKILGKNKTQILSLFSVLIFVWFAGLAPSLTRALISTIIIFFSSRMGIKIQILDVLCFSFLIQLVIFPQDSTSVSFILSYLALFGILTIGKSLNSFFIRFLGNNLSSSLCTSVGAVVITSPVCAFIWGYITPIGIISTIFISPLVTFFLIFGLISVVLCLIFPFFSYPLGTILQIVYYVIEYVATFFAKVPPLIL